MLSIFEGFKLKIYRKNGFLFKELTLYDLWGHTSVNKNFPHHNVSNHRIFAINGCAIMNLAKIP